MKIVFQHSGVLPVIKYGGIERILFWHMKELVRRGHEVILFGHEKSKVQEYGIHLYKDTPGSTDWVKEIPKDTDIIHLTYNFVPQHNAPTLNNIQGNGQPAEVFPVNSVFVSQKHAQNHGAEYYIYNALDLEEYPYVERSSKELENLLFLAKGSWSVKNLKSCVKAARKCKKNLHIAGGRSLWPSRFIHSHGMVGGQEKSLIIQNCDALLFPVRWHEPFGIAIIEAMAHGLCVFGSPYGSLPELIAKDVGTIVDSDKNLQSAIDRGLGSFSPRVIRSYVEEYFSIGLLTTRYLEAYEKIISGKNLNSSAPTWQLNNSPLELLAF